MIRKRFNCYTPDYGKKFNYIGYLVCVTRYHLISGEPLYRYLVYGVRWKHVLFFKYHVYDFLKNAGSLEEAYAFVDALPELEVE